MFQYQLSNVIGKYCFQNTGTQTLFIQISSLKLDFNVIELLQMRHLQKYIVNRTDIMNKW